MALTTGRTARLFGISRTALLYYDKLGLVSPTQRSGSGYRLYAEEDIRRLRQVLLYRDIGVPLEQIPSLLAGSDDAVHGMLFKRLTELNNELQAIKAKQHTLIGIIASTLAGRSPGREDCMMEQLLHGAGLSQAEAQSLHRGLERHSPEAHEEFLRALGFAPDEINQIRARYSREDKEDAHARNKD